MFSRGKARGGTLHKHLQGEPTELDQITCRGAGPSCSQVLAAWQLSRYRLSGCVLRELGQYSRIPHGYLWALASDPGLRSCQEDINESGILVMPPLTV